MNLYESAAQLSWRTLEFGPPLMQVLMVSILMAFVAAAFIVGIVREFRDR
jgi:hypothetical protein